MVVLAQSDRYHNFYDNWAAFRQLFRFDVRFRCQRLQAVLQQQGYCTADKRVLDVGFGIGAMLATFPKSCRITGADISASAVAKAHANPTLLSFAQAEFFEIDENNPADLPEGPFDIVLSSHTLEHVHDDRVALEAMYRRLVPGGLLVVFVPLEEPDYIPFHLRAYSLQTIVARIREAHFDVQRAEGSMCVNGHLWKVLTIPSRRQWPVMGKVADALRLATLSAVPLPLLTRVDRLLFTLGFSPRQALVLARRPLEAPSQPVEPTDI